ncbi:flagellar biosynthetic protein FliQ [uncultured Tateyamaria sp.]|uniref:flagellar biosynthetic protein FliQ n=1 Tax=uncultured Tateyamaria sp. TaxID=455651 RepID=UPI002602365F|nr:flagellar biosynthetic protein FliQ [uncultured Tateyamaria sp.]
MDPNQVLYLAKAAVLLVFYLSMPIIAAATAFGLLVAVFQTLVQVQEQTLAFAVKLVAIIVVFFISGAWMSGQLLLFFDDILLRIADL